MDWVITFFTDNQNRNEVAYVVIGIIIGLLVKAIGSFIQWLYNKIRGLNISARIKSKIKKMKVKRKYKKTIKQIERMEIPLPKHFLFNKSPEKNPELKNIYRMIDEGLIETSSSYKLQQFFKDNPELKLKLNELNLPPIPITQIKPPSLKK